MITVRPYTPDDASAWDAFVRSSRQGVFLFERGYMDYHADRFRDSSLVLTDEHGDWLALLPAHVRGTELVSHGGLSYGGLVTGVEMKTLVMIDAFAALVAYCRDLGFTRLIYKTVPTLYHHGIAGEDLIALALVNAQRLYRGMITVWSRSQHPPFSTRRRRGVKKAGASGVRFDDAGDLTTYWEMLTSVLRGTHAAAPVHTLDEMTLLRTRFPDRIHVHSATLQNELIAGVLVYRYDRVARAQYIAATEHGKAIGALDGLFDHLLSEVYIDLPYFDFGASTRPETGAINAGLLIQKEEFGARPVIHDTYAIDLAALTPDRLAHLRETPL